MGDYPEWTLEGITARAGRDREIRVEGEWLKPKERVVVMPVEDHERECERIRDELDHPSSHHPQNHTNERRGR